MKLKILENFDKDFESYVQNHPLGNVHQSQMWGKLQTKLASRGKFYAVKIMENNKIVLTALVIRQRLFYNYSFFYCMRGPLWDESRPDVFSYFLGMIKKTAEKEKAVFLRIDPYFLLPDSEKRYFFSTIETDFFFKLGFKHAHAQYQPPCCHILDISLPEDEILKSMKEKGRYNIRLAARKGVKIHIDQSQESLDKFYELEKQTGQRDNFIIHERSYYEYLVLTLAETNHAFVFSASYQNKIIASAILVCYANVGIYYYGASSNEHRNLMAPYLIQWEMIKKSKQMGCKIYDFLCCSLDPADKSDPLYGVTQFKRKFGGFMAHFGAYEYIYMPLLFKLLLILKKLRKIIRKIGWNV